MSTWWKKKPTSFCRRLICRQIDIFISGWAGVSDRSTRGEFHIRASTRNSPGLANHIKWELMIISVSNGWVTVTVSALSPLGAREREKKKKPTSDGSWTLVPFKHLFSDSPCPMIISCLLSHLWMMAWLFSEVVCSQQLSSSVLILPLPPPPPPSPLPSLGPPLHHSPSPLSPFLCAKCRLAASQSHPEWE